MPANPNWARWIHASVSKYMKEFAASLTPSMQEACLIEGIDERTDAFMRLEDRIEARVNGPYTQELSAGYHRVQVDVNVLVNSTMGGVKKNAYRLDEILGLFHNAMDGVIPIFRLGTGPDDDSDSLLGCLSPRPGQRDSVRVIHFGQIDRTDRLKQGMVDARYVMYLSE